MRGVNELRLDRPGDDFAAEFGELDMCLDRDRLATGMPARFEPAYDEGDDVFATPGANQCGIFAENPGLTLAVRATIEARIGPSGLPFFAKQW